MACLDVDQMSIGCSPISRGLFGTDLMHEWPLILAETTMKVRVTRDIKSETIERSRHAQARYFPA